jgi:hypothetical protein
MAWNVYGGTFGGLGPGMGTGKATPGSMIPIGPAEETTAAIDRVLERAQTGAVGAQREYWRLVMDRPNWCFLCNAEQVKAEMEKPEAERGKVSPQPLLWRMNEKTMVGVFTSESAAMETHRQMHNATPEMKDSELPQAAILAMPVPEAIRWLLTIPADKVSDIVVNRRSNISVAHIGINLLPGLYEWATDRLPDSLWDAFIKSVQDANQPGAWSRLRRRFGSITTWWLPADPGGSHTPLVAMDGGTGYLVVATDADAASRAFQRVVGDAAKDMKPRIGPIERSKLLKLVDTISAEEKGPKQAVINPGGTPAVIALAELAKILREPIPA